MRDRIKETGGREDRRERRDRRQGRQETGEAFSDRRGTGLLAVHRQIAVERIRHTQDSQGQILALT